MSRQDEYFSSDQLRANLRERTVRGGFFSASAQVCIIVINLAAIPILTRLLEPTDFGLIAMVTVFTSLAIMFVDSGLTMATVQKDGLSHAQASNLFWVAAGLGLLVSLVLVAVSPLVAWLYDEPRLRSITVALAAAPLLGGLTIQHQALLRRTMRLGRLAFVQVLSNLAANLIGIALAWRLRSYWALVAMPIAATALRMLGTWIACSWRPGSPSRGAGTRTLISFGANLTGFSFVNYFARSGDNLLIGWAWGESALGLYERAYRLMMMPLQQINGPLAGVMVPALSRLAGEPISYRRAYLRSISILQFASCPLMALVAVMSQEIVEVIFGPAFSPAGPILRWLAIAGFMQPLMNTLGWLYVSQGRGRELMYWGMVSGTLIVSSFVAGLPAGPVGVARAYAVAVCLLVVPLAVWFAGSRGAVTRGDLARECAVALAIALPSLAASLLAQFLLRNESHAVRLIVATLASGAATLSLLFLSARGRALIAQVKEVVRHAQQMRHDAGTVGKVRDQ